MKIKIILKDPDGFYDSVTDALTTETDNTTGLSSDEKDDLIESRRKEVNEALSRWVKYSEYVTIEFDTESGTATVLPR